MFFLVYETIHRRKVERDGLRLWVVFTAACRKEEVVRKLGSLGNSPPSPRKRCLDETLNRSWFVVVNSALDEPWVWVVSSLQPGSVQQKFPSRPLHWPAGCIERLLPAYIMLPARPPGVSLASKRFRVCWPITRWAVCKVTAHRRRHRSCDIAMTN